MILTKQNISQVDIDFLVNEKLKAGALNELLFIVPTKRKIRYLTRDLISISPGNAVAGLKIETIGSFSEKLLVEIQGEVNLINDEVSILLLSHSFRRVKLKYFSQYKDQIPFGTLERVKNVISEYKRHGITSERLLIEAKKLIGGEKLKALDIAHIYSDYQDSLVSNNLFETGDIYYHLNGSSEKIFKEAFNFSYHEVRFVIINGFDEFTLPEVEIIKSISEIEHVQLFVVFDYYKYNPAVFSHLNKCHDRLVEKGFMEIKDLSPSSHNKFQNLVRENLSFKTPEKKEEKFSAVISQITAKSREEEVELIAKEIKSLLFNGKVEANKICIVFNLIGNYSSIIRDRFNVYGIPFNLTDRLSLSFSSPVKSLLSFLEILENDFYYKNIFRALSSSFLQSLNIDLSHLLRASVELKIVSGYQNWIDKISAHLSDLTSSSMQRNNYERINSLSNAISDLKKIELQLSPFAVKLNPDEFRERLLSLIFKLNIPESLLSTNSEIAENDSIAFNTFLKILDEVTNLIKLEHGSEEKFSIHFYLNQLRTTSAFTRYNIPEKPGYGVLITTLNEIRGLSFDYLFIGGLNDGDLPTRFAPEIFFSGSFSREEIQHQTEQRYLFYQSLCAWKKKLYLSYPVTDGKRELVQSSFLKDFKSIFETKELSKANYLDFIYSKEELFQLLGKLSSEQREIINLPEEINIDVDAMNRSIDIDKKRIQDPFGESEYSGFITIEDPAGEKSKISKITEDEYSATQLETYAKCPYKYFLENILKLETIKDPVEELEAFEYGSLIHTILFEFYIKIKEKGIILSDCSDAEFKTAEEILFKIAEKKFDELKLNPDFSFFEREKLLGINGRKTQSILYKFLEEERKGGSGYIPEFFELSFGRVKRDEKSPNKIHDTVTAGPIKLRGKIDRIDLNEEAGTFKVIDYKLGGTKPSSEDLINGISLQLPLYLFAGKELIKSEMQKDYDPADAQIFSLKFNKENFGKKSIGTARQTSKDKSIDEEIKSTEELITLCLNMVNKFTDEIKKGKFNLSSLQNRETKVCKFCDFRRICRIQEVD